MWLHGKADHNQRYYRAEAEKFLAKVDKALVRVTLADLQSYAEGLGDQGLQASSQARSLAVLKSIFAFGHKIGVLPFNVGIMIKMLKSKDNLAERILSESEVQSMIGLESNVRNKTILRTLYGAGLRVSELCGLKWCDLKASGESGQVTVFGKGGKTRVILLPSTLYCDLWALRGAATQDIRFLLAVRTKGILTPRWF